MIIVNQDYSTFWSRILNCKLWLSYQVFPKYIYVCVCVCPITLALPPNVFPFGMKNYSVNLKIRLKSQRHGLGLFGLFSFPPEKALCIWNTLLHMGLSCC